MAIPTITIGTPTKTRISAVSGYDQATVTFTSDVALSEWEARATTQGQTVGHGSGLLVGSGGSLDANVEATVTIDNEELTNGDLEYTISIFGQSVGGAWSDGTYETVNILDMSDERIVYIDKETTTYSDGVVTFDTGTQNTSEDDVAIKVQIMMEDWSYHEQLMYEGELGYKTVTITKTEAFDTVRVALNGNIEDAVFNISADALMEDGANYLLAFNIIQLFRNYAQIKDITLVKV